MEAKADNKAIAPMSKKRKFVADGIFYAELNEFLTRELAEDNYSGVEVSFSFFSGVFFSGARHKKQKNKNHKYLLSKENERNQNL